MNIIEELKAALAAATQGRWVYEKERHTHDSCIHVDQPVGEYGYYGYEDGGVVGSSEWVWIREEDANLIALMHNTLPALIECVGALNAIINIEGDKDFFALCDDGRTALAKLENAK